MSRYDVTKGRAPSSQCAVVPNASSRPDHAGGEIGERVGDEDAGDVGLVGPPGAVGECCSRGAHPSGDMGEVVGHDLVDVGAAAVGHGSGGPGDHRRRHVQRGGGVVEIGYGARRRARAHDEPPEAGTRPSTVTSGGSTTGSSPGSTSVSEPR